MIFRSHSAVRFFFAMAAIAIVTSCSPSQAADKPAPSFKPIFDGKTLTGWTGDEKFWSVKDGAIIAESTEKNPCKENTFLVWNQGELDDFELKLKFRISGTEKANSGIQFRGSQREDGHVVGYQADMDRSGKYFGCLYDEATGRGMLASRGASIEWGPNGNESGKYEEGSAERLLKKINMDGWNEYHIKASGHEITLSINGHVMSKLIDKDPEGFDPFGILALQLHSGPPMKVEFKDIQLKRLPLADGRKKVVFIAGVKSHGYFSHEHNAGCLLLAKALNSSGLPVQTAVYQNGWPHDPTALDNVDTVVSYCDGGGRHYLNQHLPEFDQLANRGVGLVCLHYGVETVKGEPGDYFMKWIGGYFEPHWSVNPHWDAKFDKFPNHEIANGVKPFTVRDEWYYHMRFQPEMKGVTPILTDLPPRETLNRKDGAHSGNPHVREAVLNRKEPQHVAWAYERPDGKGRGFGFTGGHFHKNWQDDNFRKVVLNAIVWTANAEVPKDGVPSKTPTQEELEANQDYPKPGSANNNSKKNGSKNVNKIVGNSKAKPVAKSPIVTPKTPNHSAKLSAEIKGAKQLVLVATDGGNGYACDWAAWAEPTLLLKNGDKVTSSQKLTDLKWKTASSGFGTVNIGKNAGGQDIRINGKSIDFGIGTHANSVIVFELPKDHKFTHFETMAGLDNGGTDQGSCGEQSSVQFFVFTELPGNQFLSANTSSSNNASQASHDAEDALDQLDVHEDLEATLFASEPIMLNPANIDIDHLGRVWVSEVVNYRRFRNKDHEERKEGDRILILEDTNGDGKADKSTTFYQGRDIDSAHGVCVMGNKVIVSAGANVFVFTDEDGDSKADKKEVLFSGIDGVQHDHGIHAFVFGPDGKLYFNFGNNGKRIKDKNGKPIVDKAGNVVDDSRKPYQEGMVFRCNLDGSEFETLGWNFRNNWEVCVDSFGTMWQSDNDDDGNRGVRINYVMEYGNYGYKDEFTGAGWRDPRTGWNEEIPKRHWHLNDPGVVPNLLQTGAGSPTGICVYEGKLLPKIFHGSPIHTDAGPNVARAYPVKMDGAGYTATTENILVGTRDNWFRPSDVCVAPDGSIIIADWYDPGVGGHRMQDVDRGRLFRVAPKGVKYSVPKYDFSTAKGAAEALKSPNQAARYLAWQSLQKMGWKAEEALLELWKSKDSYIRARAMWAIGKLPAENAEQKAARLSFIRDALQDWDVMIRVAALRLCRQLTGEIDLADVEDSINLEDISPAVRRELLIGLREVEIDDFAGAWTQLAMGYDGKDRWYLEALGIAAEGRWDDCLPVWLNATKSRISSKALRDIVWRSRASNTADLLAEVIASNETPTEELPRFFRAMDFVRKDKNDQLASLAFGTVFTDQKRADLVMAEAIKRLNNFNVNSKPEYRKSIDAILKDAKADATFLMIVDKFNLDDRYPQLVEVAIANHDQQLGVDAVRILLAKQQWKLLGESIRKNKVEEAAKLIQAMGYSQDDKRNGVLFGLIDNEDVAIDLRREAVRSLAKTRGGLKRVEKLALDKKIPDGLTQVTALVMHASTSRDIKDTANKLFPLPPSKNQKPLPPASELAKRKGDTFKGRLVFNTTGTCAKCHVVNGIGKEVGPNLSEIGKKLSREAMFESIIYPSAGISHNYETYLVVLDNGTQATGLLTSETDDSLTLKNTDGISKTFKKSEVELKVKQKISLMPADLQKLMTEEELVNVVEYMTTLKVQKKLPAKK